MNPNVKIEKEGITNFRHFLKKSEIINPQINEEDSKQSWDGDLEITLNFKTTSQYLKKIPIQIKSSNRISKKKEKHKLNKTDLNNYFNNGGVMFIKVFFWGEDNYEVYYNLLLPVKLKKYLMNMQNDSIQIALVKCKSLLDFELICKKFINHSKLQFNVDQIKSLDTLPLNSINILLHNISEREFFSEDTFLYAQMEMKGLENIIIPITDELKEIKYNIPKNVSIGTKVYFKNILVIQNKDKSKIYQLSDFLTFSFVLNGNVTVKFSYQGNEKFLEYYNSIEFVIELINNKFFEIGGVKHNVSLNKIDRNIKNLYDFSKNIKSLLERFNIDFNDIIINDLNKEFKLLNLFINILIKNESIMLENEKDIFLEVFSLFNANIFIIFIKNKKGYCKGYDFFSDFPHSDSFSIATAGHTCKVTRFITLDLNLITENTTFDPSFLILDFKRYLNPELGEAYNNYMLGSISVYDKVNDPRILKFSLMLNQLLRNSKISGVEKEIYFINKYQIIKRYRNFNKWEVNFLIKLKEITTNLRYVMGIYALLEERQGYLKIYESLTLEERNQFDNLPIAKLIKDKESL